MKVRTCLLLIVLSGFPGLLFAELQPAELQPAAGFYFRVDGGFSDEPSAVFGGGLGYAYVAGLRADLTLTYQEELESLRSLVSLYLDLYSTERVSPYGGFGLGFSRDKLGSDITSRFAWQLCGGAAIQLSNRWLLDVGYHYVKGQEFGSHELLASLQYTF